MTDSTIALTQARLKELLHYDPLTGTFTWLVSRGRLAKAGQVAGSLNGDGYWQIKIDGVTYKAHRLAWLYMKGEWPPHEVDHWDTDRGNNRWANLRSATDEENRRNSGLPRNNTSGVRGVTWHKPSGKWVAQIGVGKAAVRKTLNLGYFSEIGDAAAARRAAEIRLFGEFSPLAVPG